MTTIYSTVSDKFLRIEDNLPREVFLTLGSEIIDVNRAEFLRAVETELDVIVINRADLPRVLPLGSDPTALRIEDDTYDIDYDHYAEALRRLAIVEHAKAHPPVDQADVDALADAIAHTTGTTREDQTHLARRLVQAGVRPPKAD